MKISCVIPAKNADDPLLSDLIRSIRAQDFPQEDVEIIVVTEGDSESAKAIGIRKATGDIICMLCADNMIMENRVFKIIAESFLNNPSWSAIYSRTYHHKKDDNSLNRYFALIGGNDPVCYYLGKNDRQPHVFDLIRRSNYQPSYGCNGFFYRASEIKATNLDHYYPMDNAMEVPGVFMPMLSGSIWHRTADGFLTFLRKRYKYARDLYCDRNDRRWKMLDTREDYWHLFTFIFFTLTIIEPVYVSIRGFIGKRDPAWFWHWPVCAGMLFTYGILVCRNVLKSRLSFRHWQGPKVSKPVLHP